MEDNFKQEALDIISDLINTINWLGGDPYEMGAIEKSMDAAQEFLDKYQPEQEDKSMGKEYMTIKFKTGAQFGVYCLRSDHSKKVEACNKKVAAKYMHVGKNQIICLKKPFD